jgi:hypothetical protein
MDWWRKHVSDYWIFGCRRFGVEEAHPVTKRECVVFCLWTGKAATIGRHFPHHPDSIRKLYITMVSSDQSFSTKTFGIAGPDTSTPTFQLAYKPILIGENLMKKFGRPRS